MFSPSIVSILGQFLVNIVEIFYLFCEFWAGIPRGFRLYFSLIYLWNTMLSLFRLFFLLEYEKISGINAWMVFDLTHLNSPHAHTLLLRRDIWKAAVSGAISYHNRGLKNSSPEFVTSIHSCDLIESASAREVIQW